MKKLKLLLPLVCLLILGSSFTSRTIEKTIINKNKLAPYYIGSFNLDVGELFEIPIDVYAEEVNGVYTDIHVYNAANNAEYCIVSGTVTISGADRISTLTIRVPSGDFPYEGLLDY